MLCATRRSRPPGSSLMRAEQDPEPREALVLVLFRAGSRSSRSPAICSRLRRQDGGSAATLHPCHSSGSRGQETHCVLGAGNDRTWPRTGVTVRFVTPYPPCAGWGWALTGTPRV